MNALPTAASDLTNRARGIAIAGWIILLLSALSALLPLFERKGGAVVIGCLLLATGLAEMFAGALRHEAKGVSMLIGAVAVAAGLLFASGPATEFFLPAVVIVSAWLLLRSLLLFYASRVTHHGVRWWTSLSAITDLVLALILIVGIPIAALVLGLFGATPDLVASFAWILALSFVADGLMLLEVASAARGNGEDV
ncbi:MAG: hypothetical protein ABI412_05335 [Sphingomicrobium sp.]